MDLNSQAETSLHLLNSLFAHTSNSKPELFYEMQKTIQSTSGQPKSISSLPTPLHSLLKLYQNSTENPLGFYFWDFASHTAEPLWIEAHMQEILNILNGFDKAIIVIAHVVDREIRYYLEDLVVSRTPETHTALNLLFI